MSSVHLEEWTGSGSMLAQQHNQHFVGACAHALPAWQPTRSIRRVWTGALVIQHCLKVRNCSLYRFVFSHAAAIPPCQSCVHVCHLLLQGYGDDTTPMGYCPRCIYSAVDQLRLGWSRALPVVDWALFSGSTAVNLPALSDAAAFQRLGVVQIRLSNPSDPGVPGELTRHIWLSYRVTKNQDASLPEEYSMATSVHGYNDDAWLLAWPKTGQAYVNAANKMVVRQDAGDVNTARVTLCKWVTVQSECGTFSSFERSRVAAASLEAPVDLEAYKGRHTWQPAGRNATAWNN